MNGTSSNKPSLGAIMYLIQHMFLPTKLPHGDDFNLKYETVLLDTTISALRAFKCYVSNITYDQSAIVDSVIAMVANLRSVHDFDGAVGAVSEAKLKNALKDLSKKGKQVSHFCDLFHFL
jgi:hypothetical protein